MQAPIAQAACGPIRQQVGGRRLGRTARVYVFEESQRAINRRPSGSVRSHRATICIERLRFPRAQGEASRWPRKHLVQRRGRLRMIVLLPGYASLLPILSRRTQASRRLAARRVCGITLMCDFDHRHVSRSENNIPALGVRLLKKFEYWPFLEGGGDTS